MLLLAIAAPAMSVLCGVIAWRLSSGPTPGGFKEFVCYVGVVLFALCAVIGVYRLVAMRGGKPVVTLSPAGVRDIRIAAEFIPWSAIRNISTWEMHRQKIMILAVDPEVEAGLTLTRIARWTRGANKALNADGLAVTAQGVQIGYARLLETTLAYAEAYRAGAGATIAGATIAGD